MSGNRTQSRLVVGDVSLTMGLVMNPHEDVVDDQYDHASAVPASADGLVVPGSVGGLQALQNDMRARVPGPVLDGAVQAAFRQLVPPGLRPSIHVLAEWDARWFADVDKPSIFSDAGAVPSHGDRDFEAACVGTVQPQDGGTLPAFAQKLRRHAWTIGPLGLAGGRHWVGVLVRLTGRDPATGLYARVAQVALVDPQRSVQNMAEGKRALRRLEDALSQAGLDFGDDVPRGSTAWTRTAWRRTLWVPRQTDADDGSCGPRYYVLAKTLFARLTALWEETGDRNQNQEEPPYDESLWSTPLSGWFDHEATRWEMVGHHAARAVQDAHYQARVTAEIVRTQHGGRVPVRAAMNLPPAPAYEAAPAAAASLFAPEGRPFAAGSRLGRLATSTPSATTTPSGTASGQAHMDVNSLFDPPFPNNSSSSDDSTRSPKTTTTLGQKRRRRTSDAAAQPRADNKRCCRVRASDKPAPPNGYPVYPSRPLDPWDWRCVRWALTDPFEARLLDMHAAHWREDAPEREAAAERARRGGEESDDGCSGSDSDGDDSDGNGDGHGRGHGHHNDKGADEGNDPDSSRDNRRDDSGGHQGNSRHRARHGEEDAPASIDDQMWKLIEKAAQATGESAELFLARHQMEAVNQEWMKSRARGVAMQAPEQPRLHDREPKTPLQAPSLQGVRKEPLAFVDAEGRRRINNRSMEMEVGRLMRGE